MRRRLALAAGLLAAVTSLAIGRAQTARSELVDATQLLTDLRVLSADDMQGRRAGTPGGLKARAYMVERFKAAGITPFGESYEHSFPLRQRGTAEARTGANVIGRVDGTAPTGKYIVVTAHYDHIGVSQSGDVFNGADDNASGAAALPALAAYFKKVRPKNTLIFAALDAEESGLEGARAFVQKPPVDVGAIVLNVNFDMIGRDPDNTLYVVGTRQQPFLKPYIERIAAKAPVKLLMGHEDPTQKEDWTRDSDHYAFCQAKIPCLYFGVEDFGQHHKATDEYATMTHDFYVRAVETGLLAIREFDAGLDSIAAARGGGAFLQDGEGEQVPPGVPAAQGSPIELAVAGGAVAGTLLLPADTSSQVPVVLIIAGSGPTDRDGNSPLIPGKNNSLRQLAEALAAQGIASVRYDKRGVAASVGNGLKETDLRFETYVDDASAWITKLRNDSRFSSVTVIGHSEGSAIGMLAARTARADAFVSIAGVARRPTEVLRDQLRPQLTPLPKLWEASETILKALEAGETVDAVPSELSTLYRPSVQPYLISWFRYTPSVEIARLKSPTLLIQGTTDLQVQVPEADALKAARPDATLKIIEGMNHVLKMAPAERAANIATYTNPELLIAPDVPASIVSFIRALRLPRHPNGERLSPRTIASAVVDGTRIAIEYGQPAVRGRAVWGGLVPWGRWWMPGADEATSFTTSGPLMVGTLSVPAGDYTLYTQPGEPAFSLVINKQIFQFHTEYRPDLDLGRVPMTMARLETPVERLTFAIDPLPGGGAAIKLRWADREYVAAFTAVAPGK
jgi:pimeloyl-ACP methyl ester carboxylesterase